MTRQLNHPCPSCGSYYVKGNICNVAACGKDRSADVEREYGTGMSEDRFTWAGRPPVGQIWDSKKHRYITGKDMKHA